MLADASAALLLALVTQADRFPGSTTAPQHPPLSPDQTGPLQGKVPCLSHPSLGCAAHSHVRVHTHTQSHVTTVNTHSPLVTHIYNHTQSHSHTHDHSRSAQVITHNTHGHNHTHDHIQNTHIRSHTQLHMLSHPQHTLTVTHI